MSVEKVQKIPFIDYCPLVITPRETILTYQTANAVSSLKDVNGRFPDCFPNDYAYLQVYTAASAPKCCSNNSLKSSINSGLSVDTSFGKFTYDY